MDLLAEILKNEFVPYFNKMRKSILVAGIVLCLLIGAAVACPPSCPPGTHRTVDKGCLKCPSRTYQDQETNSTSCIDCRQTCFQKEFTVRNCTALADLICQCKDGFYNNKLPPPYGTCVPHTECQPGYGAKVPGNHLNNTVCEPCESGYFSTNLSSTDHCVPCISCSDDEETTQECTPTSDRLCKFKDCGHLDHPDNGFVNTTSGTTYLKVAAFNCNTGYSISGSTTLLCMSSGSWSDSPPVCVIKDEELSGGVIAAIVIDCFGLVYGIVVTVILVIVWRRKSVDERVSKLTSEQVTSDFEDNDSAVWEHSQRGPGRNNPPANLENDPTTPGENNPPIARQKYSAASRTTNALPPREGNHSAVGRDHSCAAVNGGTTSSVTNRSETNTADFVSLRGRSEEKGER